MSAQSDPTDQQKTAIGRTVNGHARRTAEHRAGPAVHGRRQLRQMLRPLAEEVLTPAPTRREEQPMDPTALIDVDVAFVGRLALSTDCVVMLQEQGGPRRLALEGVDAATGEAVERLVGGDQPLAPTTTTCSPA
jgi:hypothetical protein